MLIFVILPPAGIMIANYLTGLLKGDIRSLSRCISIVENESAGFEELLEKLPGANSTKIVGITGPPGAGKSTLVNELIQSLLKEGKKVAIIAVDPSSPFNMGALLGDRIRMSQHFNSPNVYIRSLASRGALGGLSPKIIEIAEVVKAAHFDYLFIETVGVGQSEVDIAGIADTSIVVLVPEAGDEIQTMKAGLMEIANIFVVNKSDRSTADTFVKNLRLLAHTKRSESWEIPVIKSIATRGVGIDAIIEAINKHQEALEQIPARKALLLTDKLYQLIQYRRMHDINKLELLNVVKEELEKGNFNLYKMVKSFVN